MEKLKTTLIVLFVCFVLLIPGIALLYDRTPCFKDYFSFRNGETPLHGHDIIDHPIFQIYGAIGVFCGILYFVVKICQKLFATKKIINKKEDS